MPLDPDAQFVVDQIDQVPLHTLGVEAIRSSLSAQAAEGFPPPASVHEVEDRSIPGPSSPMAIRVYRPSDESALPALLYFHGGGWTVGSPDSCDGICRALTNGAQCVIVSVNYRLAPENKFPAAVDDAYAALEWLATHGRAELGIDPGRIAIGGDSAGANLSAAVCLLARDRGGPRARLQLLAYPATEYAVERESWRDNAKAPILTAEDVVWFWGQYLRDEANRVDPRATPSNAGDFRDLPPAFILTAEYDPLRDDGEQYARRLAEAGNEVTVKHYPGVFHGFLNMLGVVSRADTAIADAGSRISEAFARSIPA